MTKPIAAFSCTPRVQEVHTKAEVVHLTSCLLGLGGLRCEGLDGFLNLTYRSLCGKTKRKERLIMTDELISLLMTLRRARANSSDKSANKSDF